MRMPPGSRCGAQPYPAVEKARVGRFAVPGWTAAPPFWVPMPRISDRIRSSRPHRLSAAHELSERHQRRRIQQHKSKHRVGPAGEEATSRLHGGKCSQSIKPKLQEESQLEEKTTQQGG